MLVVGMDEQTKPNVERFVEVKMLVTMKNNGKGCRIKQFSIYKILFSSIVIIEKYTIFFRRGGGCL